MLLRMMHSNKSPQFIRSPSKLKQDRQGLASPMTITDKQAEMMGRIQQMAFSARSIRETETLKQQQVRKQFFQLKSQHSFKAPSEKEEPVTPFERQTVGVVSNLALANMNQDIEDIEGTGGELPNDQIKQMSDFLRNKDFARALITQLNGKTEVKSPRADQGQILQSYSDMIKNNKLQ